MYITKPFIYIIIFIFLGLNQASYASGTMKADEVINVKRVDITNEKDRERLSKVAGLLAVYEIEAKKIIAKLHTKEVNADDIQQKAKKLLGLSEIIIDSARFRLPQCDDYLAKALVLKNRLNKISHTALEKDYHLDGALPKAPGECYQTKDLFVHPATVIILTRDDPTLNDATKSSINAEITEVIAHTELVRQLVIY